MGSNTSNLSLYKPNAGEDGWASNVNGNFNTLDTNVVYELKTGTITASGGSSPAVDTKITGVSSNQTEPIANVQLWVDSDPNFNADYAFNYDWGQHWDDSDGEIDINITVNWDTDPGNNNDVTLRYSIQARGI